MKLALRWTLPSLLMLVAGCSRPAVVGIWASAAVTSATSGAHDTLVLASGGEAAFRRHGSTTAADGSVQQQDYSGFGEWSIETPGEGTQRLCVKYEPTPQQSECADVTVNGDTLRWRDAGTQRETVYLRVP